MLDSARYLDVSGVRTRHLQAGEGQPVVLLHGIGRSLEDWEDTVRGLSPHARVYAPDLIGFGLTDKPDVPYTLPGLARFVAHYLDAVGETRPVTLVGNSLGGAVAQTFAALYPGRTRALVLVNSAGFGQTVAPALRLMSVRGVGEVLSRPNRRMNREVVKSIFHDPAFVTPARLENEEVLSRQSGAARAYLRVLRDLGTWRGVKAPWREELHAKLAAQALPTLIVWGDRDAVLPAAHLAGAARAYPHAQTHLLRDTGHMPQVERAEEFNALVLKFLNMEDRA